MYAVGIDIGGTKIAGALVDPDGNLVRELRVPTPATDRAAIVDAVASLINQLSDGETVVGAGVAAAGFIDAEQANIVYAPNLSWRNEPFKALVEAKVEVPVLLENDANAAGWAEYRYGAGRGTKHMVMLTIGTGVGGAVVVDSKLLRGGFGVAGELGHVRVVPEGRLCGCGQYGCIEQYASGTALLRSAKELAASGRPEGARLAQIQHESGELTGLQVAQAILENDPGAVGLVQDVGNWLGQTIASLSAVLDPEVVVIGGGVSSVGDVLLNPVREAFRSHQPARGFHPELEVRAAEFLNDAGLVGAADLARRAFGKL
jgi:glucokinase